MRSPGALTGLLYHSPVGGPAGRVIAGALLSAMLIGAGSRDPATAAGASDRLDRFRELAQGLTSSMDGSPAEVYAVLDGEIVESLAAGGVFASPGFLQDRLEAFADAWGGLAVRLVPLTRTLVAAIS